MRKSQKQRANCLPPPTIQTSTSSDSLSTCRGSKWPFSSVSFLDIDCENARVWLGVERAEQRILVRLPEVVVETRGAEHNVEDGLENREGFDRASRLKRRKTTPLEAMREDRGVDRKSVV